MSIYDHLEFNHLKYIVAIAEEGTFTAAAAARLPLAQSALSRQISEMEDALGVQIFDRSRGGSTLTDAGESLLRELPELIDGSECGCSESIAMTTTPPEHVICPQWRLYVHVPTSGLPTMQQLSEEKRISHDRCVVFSHCIFKFRDLMISKRQRSIHLAYSLWPALRSR